MDAELRPYLDNLAKRLRLDPRTQQEILLELQGHLEDRASDLEMQGLSREVALSRAVEYLGRPDSIASGMYAVHSKGSWRDALVATVPHLLLAGLFALHLWTRYSLLILVLLAVAIVAVQGWKKGNPNWNYSWIGYCVAAPVLSWFMATLALGYGIWSFVTGGGLPLSLPLYVLILAYVPFSLWIIARLVTPLVRRDWLLASLTALPFPFLATWTLFLNSQGSLWGEGKSDLHQTDGDRALVFLALAVTTAVFIKLGQRIWKIGLLTVSTGLMVAFTVVAIPFTFGVLAAILIVVASIAFLLSPAILMSKLERDHQTPPAFDINSDGVTSWSPNMR